MQFNALISTMQMPGYYCQYPTYTGSIIQEANELVCFALSHVEGMCHMYNEYLLDRLTGKASWVLSKVLKAQANPLVICQKPVSALCGTSYSPLITVSHGPNAS